MACIFVGLLVGCGGAQTRARSENAPYPLRLLTATSRQPAFFSSRTASTAVVSFNSHIPIAIFGPSVDGRVQARIAGPMPMEGYIADTDVVARVQRSGEISGTPVFVAGNDIVHVLSARPDGHAIVRAQPEHLLVFDESPRLLVQAFGPDHPGFTGEYPVARLGSRWVERATDTTRVPGTQARLTVPAQLLDAPNGTPLADQSYDSGVACRVVSERDGFAEILIGTGPYVRGFVPRRAITTVPEAEAALRAQTEPAPFRHPLVALQGSANETGELVNVPSGASVRDGDRVLTTLLAPGYARVIARDASDAEVLVTVDGRVVVHGRVGLDALGAPATLPPEPRGSTARR